MKNASYFIAFLLLLICTSLSFGQSLDIGDQTGDDFTYDMDSEYVTISLKDLNLPDISDDSSAIAQFFKKLFFNRKRFGLAYVEVITPFNKPEKTILFTFEREEAERYSYSYIGASDRITFPLSNPFVYSKPVVLKIVLKEWEDEKSSAAVKKIIGAINQTGISGNAAVILSNATLILDLVEQIFKPDSIEEALSLRIKAQDIQKSDLQIIGDNSNFFRLFFTTQSGFFSNYDLQSGILNADIKSIDSWKKVIHNADLHLKSDGLDPLVSAIYSFSDYVSELSLNKSDRAIMTACAVRNWAPNASNGVTNLDGDLIQFTAHHYSRLPTGNLKIIRKSQCDFTGVDCRTIQCHAMSDFINKSATTAGRKQAADLYLKGELTVIIDGVEKLLSIDQFVSQFRIRRPAFFKAEPTGPMSWSYHFEPKSLSLSINENSYQQSKIRMDIIKEKVDSEWKFYIAGIEILSS